VVLEEGNESKEKYDAFVEAEQNKRGNEKQKSDLQWFVYGFST
jgi:hypothetical protein